jgi:hypothetical protein
LVGGRVEAGFAAKNSFLQNPQIVGMDGLNGTFKG